MTGQSIDRPVQTEMSCVGAAFLAGLAGGRLIVESKDTESERIKDSARN